MKQKIFVLVMMLLICLSTIVSIPSDLEVKAIGGGGNGEGEEGNPTSLDYEYIWDVTLELADVVHKNELWGEGDEVIRKGRGFGTNGDRWTANYTEIQLNEMDLENVTQKQITTLPSKPSDPIYLEDIPWNCDLKVETIDFNLTINNPNWTFTNGHIPKNETGVMPCAAVNNRPWTPGYWTMDYKNEFTNAKLVPKNFNENWVFFGASAEDYYNVSSLTILTQFPGICGNATYIANGESLPEDQEDRVFLFDEEEGCNYTLNNVTNASGVILIHDIDRGYKEENYDYTNSTTQIARINNESNLTTVIEMLQNGTKMVVDNLIDNETLTFMHNFSHLDSWWPDEDFFIVGNYSHANIGTQALLTRVWNVIKRWAGKGWCLGFIAYFHKEVYDIHIMESTKFKWRGGGSDLEYQKFSIGLGTFPHIQIFSVNRTVGKWLENNASDTTVTGHFEQRENNVEAYNVVGNLSISESPEDAIVILSGRYDAHWGECPGDSGAGTAIIMGIAKYFTDYDITPKYNLSFVFTTGEEYYMRGSWYHSLTHHQDKYNIIRWIGTDQLGFTQPEGSNFYYNADSKNYIDNTTVSTIINESDFESKTGLDFKPTVAELGWANSDDVAWLPRDNCNTTVFYESDSGTNPPWFRHHSSGVNYTDGDSMKYMNQSEVNETFELVWDVIKYYTVNPDCWGDVIDTPSFDSDDGDGLHDSIRGNYTLTSILPHDTVRVNVDLIKSWPYEQIVNNSVINFTANRTEITETVNLTVPEDASPGHHYLKFKWYNSTGKINEIVYPDEDNYNQSMGGTYYYLYPYGYGLNPPVITNVADSPDPVGHGFNVTISADVTSSVSDIDMVSVNVTYPDDSFQSFTMSNTEGDTYEYVFNDTWQQGEYDYGIWARDINGNESGSPMESFNVSAQATVSVCTVEDEYGDNENVNITDPPMAQIGYELFDDGDVLRIWNSYDSYYFDTDSGIQFTNHYNEYWSTNVLMLGYYNNDVWNLIYRTDELSGFNKDIECDGVSFVDATLWKDLEYEGYDFRLAVRYHLGVDDNELTIKPYIKNIDDEDIPYNLGFAWELKDIQVDMTPDGDYIEIDNTWYYLNEEIDEIYTDLDQSCYYIREDKTGNTFESLYLKWDNSLNYKVKVKSKEGQYNAPVTLGIKIGTLSVGQEKQTSLFWHDASEATYYFDDYMVIAEEWATNPANMVDGSTSNFAETFIDGDVELCHNNTCTGTDLGTISKVEIRAYGKYSSGQRDIILRPVFTGKDGNNHNFVTTTSPDWSQWFDITNDNNAPSEWDWNQIRDMDCDVEAEFDFGMFTLYCSKVEIRVTYNVNYAPGISTPLPQSGSTGISIAPLLGITVNDAEGDNMNISWLSNSSGSWQEFGTNNSVGNGTYYQTMSNASVNGQWWYWKVNVTDGTNYNESSIYKLYTGYESKIVNTGSTHIKGYLLMQVQFYNVSSSTWVVADDTINETSTRTMYWDDPLGVPGQSIFALDSVFNGLVDTNDISGFGNGTYRVYIAFRDPDGNVLVCDDESLMTDNYEFTITFI